MTDIDIPEMAVFNKRLWGLFIIVFTSLQHFDKM